jgi:hypothetical protein
LYGRAAQRATIHDIIDTPAYAARRNMLNN